MAPRFRRIYRPMDRAPVNGGAKNVVMLDKLYPIKSPNVVAFSINNFLGIKIDKKI